MSAEKKIYEKSNLYLRWAVAFFLLIFFDLFLKLGSGRIYKNYNFAFSLPMPKIWMYAIYVVSIIAMTYFFLSERKKYSIIEKTAWLLVFTGAFLNIVERLVLGYVRDWIYIWTGVFNLADIYIFIGAGMFLFFETKRLL